MDCGIRVHGSDYRRPRINPTTKVSFRLYFRGDYGPGQLDYPLFPLTTVRQFDQIVLRSGFDDQDNPFIRDEIHRRLSHDMGQVASHGTLAILFLNGVMHTNSPYYNPCERVHQEFFQRHLGGGDYWDVVGPPWTEGGGPVDGTFDDFQALVDYVDSHNPAQPSVYTTISQWLDLTNFVDYLILNTYTAMGDWPVNNWRAGRDQGTNGIWRFAVWDAEYGMGLDDRTVDLNSFTLSGYSDHTQGLGTPSEISTLYQSLRRSLEFRLLWADRLRKHFFNGGALTKQNITNRFEELRSQLSALIPNMEIEILEWARDRQAIYYQQMYEEGLLAPVASPGFNQFGGRVPAGFNLIITNATGTIYFTLDGSDPRVPFTGAVSSSAIAYSGPVPLDATVTVRTRSLQGTNWSAITEATFTVGSLGIPLRITELMYNPSGGSLHEFLELQNTGPTPVDLSGMYFDGISFSFPEGAKLAGGARLVLGANTDTNAWKAHYQGVTPFGWYANGLNNAGERIILFDRFDSIITSVDYKDSGGWPKAADGGGRSLEITDPNGNPDDPANWHASAAANGSPGAANSAVGAPPVYLNELMAINLNAVGNGGTFPDWIELANPSDNPVNLSGWSLTDDGNARKFVFPPGTTIAGPGFLVVWCDAVTNTTPGLHTGFSLDSAGESLFLYDAATNRIDAVTFGHQLTNYSLGRIGGKWTLNTPTPKVANQPARLAATSNLVLNEWFANPVPGGSDWVELFNGSDTLPVSLQGIYLARSNGLHQLTSLSFLPPLGHIQVFADEGIGADHLHFTLPASGGVIILSDATGAEIDKVSYDAQSEGVSQGRLPDGGALVMSFPGSVSPGTANYINSYHGPVVNEVLARNRHVEMGGRAVDWFELFNPTDSNFDLGGMSLSVNSQKAREWVFPAGTTLESKGYLLIQCDGASPVSTNAGNFNIGKSLDGDSGGIYLFDVSGQLVSSVEYGPQVEDLSIGLSGGQWQLLSTPTPGSPNASAAVLASTSALRVNEWMAAPSRGADWFEVFNSADRPVDLSSISLSDDPSMVGERKFVPAPLSFIGANGFVKWVADSNPSQGRNHANFALDGGGDSLLLYSLSGLNPLLVDSVAFGAETRGVSKGSLPDGADNFIPFPGSPSPGASNYRLIPNVVINEALAHTDPPLEDAIELYNPTAAPVDIGGWYLSNSKTDRRKYQIPQGTTISESGYLVIYENQFNDSTTAAFTLNSAHGDEIWLSAAVEGVETGERTFVQFGASVNGVSLGRVETSQGTDFVPLVNHSFGVDNPATVAEFRTGTGRLNAAPSISPIVISEILYHPSGGTNGSEEFIELCNHTSQTVFLYDPASPANHWKLGGGVEFTFPAGASLAPGGCLLVVDFDPVTRPAVLEGFRARYNLAANVPIYGPFTGSLDNDEDDVELLRPDTPQQPPSPDAGFVPYVAVDHIHYSDTAPWPKGAVDGGGHSLQRVAATLYGNEPANWSAAAPTPGAANTAVVDTDGDGIPDIVEVLMRLDPNNPADGVADPDGDGLTNYQEYLAGTDHLDSNSLLRFSQISIGESVVLTFDAVTDRTYSILYSDSLANPVWSKLADVPGLAASRTVSVTNIHAGEGVMFYRLVTPAIQP
ncbi:MAG TPA: lamin tail domain-containing protein [Clostridia bacterium]|nr:lamin tail domain-containing protein [Clostridia bacterium]